MVGPIQFPWSDTDDQALVDAILRATKQNAPIQLQPGTDPTKPGKSNRITIGSNGLTIGPAPRQRRIPRPVIKRPDHPIDLAHPDDNHGLFFVPSPPTTSKKAQATWKLYQREDEKFEFAIVIRERSASSASTSTATWAPRDSRRCRRA